MVSFHPTIFKRLPCQRSLSLWRSGNWKNHVDGLVFRTTVSHQCMFAICFSKLFHFYTVFLFMIVENSYSQFYILVDTKNVWCIFKF